MSLNVPFSAAGRSGFLFDIIIRRFFDGGVCREIAAREGLEPTREDLGSISKRYFDDMGEGCFVRLLAEKIRNETPAVIGISGIRSLADVTILKSVFGNDCALVNVDVTDPGLSFEQMKARGEGRDPQSYDQFLQQEEREEDLFHIEKAQDMADFTIHNDGTLADLHAAIDRLVREKNLLGFIPGKKPQTRDRCAKNERPDPNRPAKLSS